MEDNHAITPQEIEKRLIVLRNQKVMLDRDVAYVYGVETKRVNEAVKNANQSVDAIENLNPLLPLIQEGSFEIQQVDLCLNTNDNHSAGLRHDIRIIKNARNSSGVETIMNDDSSCAVEE